MDRLKPLVQRGATFLEHRANAHRELLQTVAALLEAVTDHAFRVFLAGLRADAFEDVDAVHPAAMRAHRTIGPQQGFHLGEGRFFVTKMLEI